ncbi:hypothetical protein MPER_07351, partial [Moniliophthora perniciosa FA553]
QRAQLLPTAADGYARVKEGSLGVVLTTFGVGELSAINGIAGVQQKTKPMLHHTLGDGRYDAYIKAAEQFTIAQATLTSKSTAPSEIDRARPAYLTLPTDLVYTKVSSERLKVPISRLPPCQ